MFHRKVTRIALVAGLAIAMAGALGVSFLATHVGAAHATPPTSATITTAILFGPPANHGTFVATAPLCPTGTFVDEFQTAGGGPSPQFTALLYKTLTCDDGSGTFTIQFHAHFPREDEGGSTPWTVLSGTGAYATLHGTGNLTFVRTGPVSGIETLTGKVHFD